MRIIFLNTWHGKVWNNLRKFLITQLELTNIFCFLEVDPSLKAKIESLLPEFALLYERGIKTNYMGGVTEGRAIFIKKPLKVKAGGSLNIFRAIKNDAGGFQSVEIDLRGKKILIANVHGKANPGEKLDTKARINQSGKIIDFLKNKAGSKIIGGDFNLMPETKSVRMFEEAGYKNLIKDFGIKNTRNRLSWERFPVKQYYSDFVFTSPEVKIKDFSVPNIEISDHLPLILDFDI